MKKRIGALALILACTIYAEDPKEEFFQDVIRLDETTISGDGFENTIRDTPKNISIVTSKDIEVSGAKNIIEALRMVPSIKVSQGSGNTGIIDIRGQGKNSGRNTSVLIDGIKMTPIDMSKFDFNSVPIETVDRIEIIPSNASVIYGDNTVGGAINIITKKGEHKDKLSFLSELGSYDSSMLNLNFSNNVKDFVLFGNYSKKKSDGYRENQFLKSDDVALGGEYKINDKNSFTLKYNYHKDEKGDPGSLKKEEVDENRKQTNSPDKQGLNESNQLLGIYSYKDGNIEINNSTGFYKKHYESNSFLGKNTENKTNNFKMKYSNGKNKLTTGLDYLDGKVDNKGSKWNKTKSWAGKESFGVFLSNTYKLTDKLDINGGVRQQRTEFEYSDEKEKSKYDSTVYDLALDYKYSDTGSTFISYGTDFRTPLTNELLAANGFLNKEFKPQTGSNTEIGIKDYIAETFVTTSLFYKKNNDEIYLDVNDKRGGNWGTNKNYDGNSEKIGIEIFLEREITQKLSLSASYSYLTSKFTDGEFKDKEIPGVANNQASIQANYKATSDLNFNVITSYVGDAYAISDEQNSHDKVDEYIIVDLNISYKINPSFNIYGGINNLTDTEYYESVQELTWGRKYYPAPERNYYVGFSYKM